jgi:hypothetical protein
MIFTKTGWQTVHIHEHMLKSLRFWTSRQLHFYALRPIIDFILGNSLIFDENPRMIFLRSGNQCPEGRFPSLHYFSMAKLTCAIADENLISHTLFQK